MAKLTKPARDRISATKFAFPKQRKEPLDNASHVRNAVARFKQVKGVTEAAWRRERDGSTMGCLAAKSRVARVCKRAGFRFFGTKF